MLRSLLLYSIAFVLSASQAFSQFLNRPRFRPNELNNPGQTFCQADVMNVEFQADGFNGGNIFRVQLSNATGGFGNPVVIGQLTATGGNLAQVACNIPPGTPPGSNYRIRVVSTAPVFTSEQNEHPFTIASGLAPGVFPGEYGMNKWIAHVHTWTTTASNITEPIANTINFFDSLAYTARFEVDSLSFNFDFGQGAVRANIPGVSNLQGCTKPDFFAIRFRRRQFLDSGFYSFRASGDDGFRFSTDGGATWIISSWREQAPTTVCHNNCCGVRMEAGIKDLVFEFFEEQIGATCSLTIEKAGPPGPITSPPAFTVCSNREPFVLNFTPQGGVYTGTGVSRDGLFNPAVGGIGPRFITYRTGIGPCTENGSVTITVIDGPNATITGLDTAYCIFDSPATFSATPAGGTLTGPGITGNQFSPSVAGVGTHTIQYIVNDPAGCSDTANVSLVVSPGGPITFEVADSVLCHSESVSLSAVPAGGQFFGPGVSGTTFNATSLAPGIYTVRYRISGSVNCGDTAASARIRVKRRPNAGMTNLPSSVCVNGGPITLVPAEAGGVFSGSGISGSTFNPADVPDSLQITLRYRIEVEGCADSSRRQVSIDRSVAPELTLAGFGAQYCSSDPAFTITGQPAGGFWLLNNNPTGTTLTPGTLGAGNFTLTYVFKPASVCIDTLQASASFGVIATPVITGLQNQTIIEGESVQLNAAGADLYTWTPASGLSANNISNPVAKPTETTTYTVEGKDATGFCTGTGSVTIRVFEPLFIPNVITLNNDDKNDTWAIKGLRSRTLNKIEIFDRWGKKVLAQSEYTTPWDGKVNGKVNPGTYFFHIDFNDDTDRKGLLTILGEGD